MTKFASWKRACFRQHDLEQEDTGGGWQDDPGEGPCGHEPRMRSGWAERYLGELRGLRGGA